MKKLLCLLSAVVCLASCAPRAEKEYSTTVYAMDTVMELKAYGENAEEALRLSKEKIIGLDGKLRRGSESSEIYALNSGKTVTVSDETCEIISKALEIVNETGGAFDISLAPVTDLWGFYTKDYYLPTEEEIEEARDKTGCGGISLSGNKVSMGKETKIDLGGIAKGYLAGKIAGIYRECGVRSGIVSLGGNVQAIGKRQNGKDWNVAVMSPDSNGYLGVVSVSDKAVVTSGGYQRFFEKDGKVYHHIIDPETGYPAESGLVSVTVVCDDPTLADGLSTAIYVMGMRKGLEFRQKKGGFELILEDDAGKIFITEGLENSFSSEHEYEILK